MLSGVGAFMLDIRYVVSVSLLVTLPALTCWRLRVTRAMVLIVGHAFRMYSLSALAGKRRLYRILCSGAFCLRHWEAVFEHDCELASDFMPFSDGALPLGRGSIECQINQL